MFSRRVAAALSILPLLSVPPAAAQDTRAQVLEQQRAAKAAEIKPYQPGKIEGALVWFERNNPLTKVAPRNGFYIQYGYQGKPVGSGIAFGAGWRHDLFDRNARIVFEAGRSLRGYQLYRTDFSLPQLAGGRMELGLEGALRRHPQEDFYGLGFESQRDDRTNFLYEAPEVQGRVMYKPSRRFNAGLRAGLLKVSLGKGTDKRFPDTSTRFADAAAPGLAAQPDYTYGELFTTFDTRDQPGNPRAGSYAGVSWRRYNDGDLDRYTFDAVEADLQQFLPIFDKKRVIALRARVMTTSAGNGQDVPFYFQPTLGGGDSLRSASDFRFRDRNVLAINAEYRWEAFSGLDMALFTDFGKVAPQLDDLDFTGMKRAYGIGLRFNTYKAVFLRFDVAAGGKEGVRMFLKYSTSF